MKPNVDVSTTLVPELSQEMVEIRSTNADRLEELKKTIIGSNLPIDISSVELPPIEIY